MAEDEKLNASQKAKIRRLSIRRKRFAHLFSSSWRQIAAGTAILSHSSKDELFEFPQSCTRYLIVSCRAPDHKRE